MNNNDLAAPVTVKLTGPNGGDMTATIEGGLTKLEWFAGMAMHGLHDTDGWATFDDLAQACFKLAEAMLAEMEKRK